MNKYFCVHNRFSAIERIFQKKRYNSKGKDTCQNNTNRYSDAGEGQGLPFCCSQRLYQSVETGIS